MKGKAKHMRASAVLRLGGCRRKQEARTGSVERVRAVREPRPCVGEVNQATCGARGALNGLKTDTLSGIGPKSGQMCRRDGTGSGVDRSRHVD